MLIPELITVLGMGTLVMHSTRGPVFGLWWWEVTRGGSAPCEARGKGPSSRKRCFLTEKRGGRDQSSLSPRNSA